MLRGIRASVVQACTERYSLDDTLLKLERLTRLARDRDRSQLCVFPEALYYNPFMPCVHLTVSHLRSIGGYPKYSSFGAVVGERSEAGREEFAKYYAAAIDIPSSAITRMEDVSRETGVFLVVGVIERAGGTLYCTIVFIDSIKGYMGKHRKLMPTGTERLIWGQGNGSTLPVIEADFGTAGQPLNAKISASICW